MKKILIVASMLMSINSFASTPPGLSEASAETVAFANILRKPVVSECLSVVGNNIVEVLTVSNVDGARYLLTGNSVFQDPLVGGEVYAGLWQAVIIDTGSGNYTCEVTKNLE